ncbi:MAG: lytic transglycosylase [SAR86 cluster bacterium]|uniref:Lytic transglycosylase n=1 Tax=SAR86 cluster bacterium TaxID=2030880 RepID=A0A2A5CCE2_9GAMM|nr:LysM peptidoglycan-binding domain-containing protein [Gammaproteobacteria bacterium AH-315-E17]PCJ41120.1 MAG: lytic transglycosylase [SAR86 cluster bacterium]
MRRYFSFQLGLLFCIGGFFFSAAANSAESDFPVPDNIRPAIDFWIKVYTEADTESGFLHDAENLSIIYTKLNRDRTTINNTRDEISNDLRVLAGGKRSGLTRSQQGILALWPDNVSNERLTKAANSVRWQLGQRDRFIAGLQRAGAYREHIEEVVRSKGMPVELAILPHVESSFHPGAYSSAAATGMWQFVRATAQRFMRVDYVVDERLDPYSATYGAMELLEFNHNALGSWPLALTAYNHGANGIARAVRDVGSNDIGRIIGEYKGPRFGFASRNFYPQFLAALQIDSNYQEYYGNIQLDSHPGFYEEEMESYVSAADLSRTLSVSVASLQRDNPALQPAVWSGTKRIPKGYSIKVRRDALTGDNLMASLNGLPLTTLFSEQIPDLSYIVRRGDSLSVIAERYRTTISELVAINQLRNRNTIRIGQQLLLPQQDGFIPTLVINDDTRLEIPANSLYEVRRGDTLSIIAERYEVSVDSLVALNALNNQGMIFPGQSLRLRSTEAFAQTTTTGVATTAEEESIEDSDIEVVAEVSLGIAAAVEAELNATLEAVEADVMLEENAAQLLADLSADPADYSVAGDGSIEIQAIETLGHYADWLGIRTQVLRNLNGLAFRDPVKIGGRLKLDFSTVDQVNFENRRREFHRDLQQQYFTTYRIQQTEEYSIRRSDFLGNLARQRSVPMWLFRQYNPKLNFERLQIGQVVVFPVVQRVAL